MSNGLQRTGAWFAARCGCLTASAVSKILPSIRELKSGEIKKTYGEARETLLNVLVAERMSGNAKESFVSEAMQWGIDHEDEARARYAIETGELVDLVGFIKHPNVQWLGASPDGLVGNDGLIEIKCPAPHTHVEYLRLIRRGIVPDDYKPQMLLQLVVTGRQWCDFITYDPRNKQRPFACIRYAPTTDERVNMLDECMKFLVEVGEEMNMLLNWEQEECK